MLAIVYKNLIETRKSLLILLGGISFIFVDFFISLIITTDNSDDKNLIVSVLLGLGMVCTVLTDEAHNASAGDRKTYIVKCESVETVCYARKFECVCHDKSSLIRYCSL